MSQPLLSIGMIVKNEERCLEKCLKALEPLRQAIPCELVIADTGSTDKTKDIASKYADALFDFTWVNDFSKARNAVIAKCSGQWFLSLDADETLTPELVEEIRKAVQDNTIDGYKLTRVNHFLGKRMNHSGIDKEHILRLVRTEKAEYRGGLVHEVLHVEGKVKRLKGVFEHRSYTDIDGYFVKFNKYTSLAAETMFKKGKKCSIPVIVLRTPLEFLRRYVLRLGFLDGVRGLIWAAFSAFYTFVKYIKLWFLWQRNRFQ